MQIYTTSTIGDGLVSQIPALLISVATGMVVTRSASENSLSEDLTSQFLAQPRVLMTAGGAAACLCLIPGFPVPQILMISAMMIGGGYALMRRQKTIVADAAEAVSYTHLMLHTPICTGKPWEAARNKPAEGTEGGSAFK